MDTSWDKMSSAVFFAHLRLAMRVSTTKPPELSELIVPNWPPSPHEVDWVLRQQQWARYDERLSSCRTQRESYDVQLEMEAELMPLLKQILPEIYDPRKPPAYRAKCLER
jgi:hypothetical protein